MYIKLILKILSLFDYLNKIKIINFFFKKNLKNKLNNFFDVGSHHGETIKIFNKYFSIDKFYAFEASPINFKNLKKRILLSKYPSVELFNIALGNKKENYYLNNLQNHNHQHS